jgi:hypothetical protein
MGMITAILNLFIMFRLMDSLSGFGGILIYAGLVVGALLCFVVLRLALYSTFKKATDLQLYHEKLVLNERTIQAKEIKMIMRKGYFKPVIGILPLGNKVVPTNMTFRFLKDEDKGLSDLKNWAERNHVKMSYKSFQSWWI